MQLLLCISSPLFWNLRNTERIAMRCWCMFRIFGSIACMLPWLNIILLGNYCQYRSLYLLMIAENLITKLYTFFHLQTPAGLDHIPGTLSREQNRRVNIVALGTHEYTNCQRSDNVASMLTILDHNIALLFSIINIGYCQLIIWILSCIHRRGSITQSIVNRRWDTPHTPQLIQV